MNFVQIENSMKEKRFQGLRIEPFIKLYLFNINISTEQTKLDGIAPLFCMGMKLPEHIYKHF